LANFLSIVPNQTQFCRLFAWSQGWTFLPFSDTFKSFSSAVNVYFNIHDSIMAYYYQQLNFSDIEQKLLAGK
jgi:hypothetical protein